MIPESKLTVISKGGLSMSTILHPRKTKAGTLRPRPGPVFRISQQWLRDFTMRNVQRAATACKSRGGGHRSVNRAGLELIRCGCSEAAWAIEIAAAIIFSLWIVASRT